MSAADLILDLARLGIRIEAHSDRLRYSPRSAVTPDLAERMRTHLSELLAILKGKQTTILCPWCRGTTLVDGRRGVWCTNCERLAWLYEPNGAIIRADHANHDFIDPPGPCPECGTLELWQTLEGNWRCTRCDSPTTAQRLRDQSARLRSRSHRLPQDVRKRRSTTRNTRGTCVR